MKEFGTRGKLVAVLFALTTMLGCGALDAGTPAAQSATGLVATSSVVDFGNVAVGTTAVRTNTIANTSSSPIVLTRAQIAHSDFTISGQKLPLTLAPGQRVVFQIAYSPQNGGSSESTVLLASNRTRLFSTFTLRGTAILPGRIRLTPANLSFGNVPVGKTQNQSATLSNPGKTAVTITHATISGSGFTLSGLSLPLTLQAGKSIVVDVTFKPAAGGATNGTISVVGAVSTASPIRVFSSGQGTRLPVAFSPSVTTVSATVSGIGMGAGQLAVSPASLALGNVRIGGSQTQSATLINSGTADLTIRQATVTGNGFRITGISFPLTLAAGQRKSFTVTFTPQSAGSAAGSIAVTSDDPNAAVSVPVSGTGMGTGQLAVLPASLALGSVRIGGSQTQSATLINSGTAALTIRQATVTGRGFRVSGVSFPLTLAAGQRKSFTVTFTPQSAGNATGSIAVVSDDPNAVVSVPVSATATASGAIISNPSSLSFRNVQVGKAQTLSAALTNSGSSSVTVSQANVTGAGFTVSDLNLPVTLAAGQSAAFTVSFNPQSSGSASGTLSFASDATNNVLAIPLAATTAAAPVGVLSTSDSSLNFGGVKINATGTQSETLTNSGAADVTITQAKLSGTGFSTSGLNLPLTLTPGQSFTFGTTFTPASGGNFNGSISVVSDASDSTLTITLAGTASVSGQLAVSPATLSFGSVTVGQSKSLTASLTATGSSITVSSASASTSEFTVSGLSLPITLAAGQSASFTVNFKPQASGAASASASFTSNASNPSAQQSLAGSGAAAPQHNVALHWDLGPSSVVGYNIYRGTTAGGPYSKINSMNADNTYTDSSVQSGQTYFYVTTAVDGSGRESANSNQIQAVIPTP